MLIATPPNVSALTLAKMPSDLSDQISELMTWARANERDARKDTWFFWGLKIPAVAVSASAGVWGHYQFADIGIVAGALGAVCVVVDGFLQPGRLLNLHKRASHDIAILATRMASEWRSREGINTEEIARKIVRDSNKERTRIEKYVRDGESALNTKGHAT
jgi:hypothetical protein